MEHREIKFRGFQLEAKKNKWVYGSYDWNWEALGKSYIYTLDSRKIQCHLVSKESVGQYTGLKDKNGKEIFEGDIFEVASNKKYTVKYIDSGEYNYEIIAATFVLYFSDTMYFPFDEYAIKNGVIIGNIYENQELLK